MSLDLSYDIIGLGNGLVTSGNMPLPEPALTRIHVTVRRHWATELCY